MKNLALMMYFQNFSQDWLSKVLVAKPLVCPFFPSIFCTRCITPKFTVCAERAQLLYHMASRKCTGCKLQTMAIRDRMFWGMQDCFFVKI